MPCYNAIISSNTPCAQPYANGFVPSELSHQDAHNLRVRSVATHSITRIAPVLTPGAVYTVNYTEMFTWTRQSHTNAAYGPTADCNSNQMQDWHYTCQDAQSKTSTMQGGDNYMFVVGPINQAPSCMLLFFFNSCKTLDLPYRSCLPTNADGTLPQGIYLPAIYDRDTGTIFSETFKTSIQSMGNLNELSWHIYGKAHTVGSTPCCTRLTMTRAKVYAHLCDQATATSLQNTLLAGILTRFKNNDSNFLQWVAANYSVPSSDPFMIKPLFIDQARPALCSAGAGGGACSAQDYLSPTFAAPAPFTPCTNACNPSVSSQPLSCPAFYPQPPAPSSASA